MNRKSKWSVTCVFVGHVYLATRREANEGANVPEDEELLIADNDNELLDAQGCVKREQMTDRGREGRDKRERHNELLRSIHDRSNPLARNVPWLD